MFIIFGWGRQTVKKFGPVKVYHCGNCNNSEYWVLYRRITWITLFFIPVIPYSFEYLMLCPICNHGETVDKAKFEELRAVAECNLALINKEISPEEHSARLNQLKNSGSSNSSHTDYNLSGKTETQINYIKQMEEFERERAAKASEQNL